ncbi:hypothetical protein [Aquimarina sp. RZ0]|uniref:hypothetical protein n=1 Tax=Aquimarina sp. RZ0 TaxID=2607730 RepID=UPI0011F38F64|nr:hypothetical protein [Aquimarina sp. RZ0]KAA1246672.1 hypothetical protein F0000_06420 [Aquimarina sp. RZ0]
MKKNLVVVKNDYEIDLTSLEYVRENLNGFWIPENNPNGKEILWLYFRENKNLTDWDTLPFTEEIRRTEILPYKPCATVATLIKVNNETQLQFVSRSGQDTVKIDQLTKTKFKIDGVTYLRHKGYDFLRQ